MLAPTRTPGSCTRPRQRGDSGSRRSALYVTPRASYGQLKKQTSPALMKQTTRWTSLLVTVCCLGLQMQRAESDVSPYQCTFKNQPIQILKFNGNYYVKVLDVESAIVAAEAGNTPSGSYITTGSGAYLVGWRQATWDVNAADISGECCHELSVNLSELSTCRFRQQGVCFC